MNLIRISRVDSQLNLINEVAMLASYNELLVIKRYASPTSKLSQAAYMFAKYSYWLAMEYLLYCQKVHNIAKLQQYYYFNKLYTN